MSPSFASLIEMAVCSCVRWTGGKDIKVLHTWENKGDEENLIVFQPKGSSRCWVVAIDVKRLVMLKKVSGRIRAYGIPQTNILPYTP
jgi:hypothetical protein